MRKINLKNIAIAVVTLFIVIAIFIFLSLHHDVDSKKINANVTQDSNVKIEKDNSGIKTKKFLDVYRKKHTVKININALKNTYKNKNFTYISKASNGKNLVKKGSKKLPNGQQKGYTGIIKYENEKYSSKFGIDVSKHQGIIDWKKVKKAGVQFAILRIGYRSYGEEGQLIEDESFKRNIKEAHKQGIEVGVYFFSQAKNKREAIEEAKFTIKLIGKNKLELPVVFDPEHIDGDVARTDKVTGKQFTKNALAYCKAIKKAGFKPMIYSNMMWEAYEFKMDKIKDYPIWYADYEKHPQTPYNFYMWQYSQAGQIDGIEGVTDLDMYIYEK